MLFKKSLKNKNEHLCRMVESLKKKIADMENYSSTKDEINEAILIAICERYGTKTKDGLIRIQIPRNYYRESQKYKLKANSIKAKKYGEMYAFYISEKEKEETPSEENAIEGVTP